jgi:hypothetical protein
VAKLSFALTALVRYSIDDLGLAAQAVICGAFSALLADALETSPRAYIDAHGGPPDGGGSCETSQRYVEVHARPRRIARRYAHTPILSRLPRSPATADHCQKCQPHHDRSKQPASLDPGGWIRGAELASQE